MGLRAKIVLLFVISFGLLALVGGSFLQWRLHADFDTIETRNATLSMQQLARNIQSEIEHLDDLNTDWGHWDGLYNFMRHQDRSFARNDLGVDALISARLNLLTIFDRQLQPVAAHALDTRSGTASSLEPYAPVLAIVTEELRRNASSNRCGLFSIPASALILCWQPIYRSDGTGDHAGSVLMARLLDQRITTRMQRQSELDFSLQALPLRATVMAAPSKTDFHPREIGITAARPGVLQASLPGITGEPTLGLSLRYARDVSTQGQSVIGQPMAFLFVVVALAAVVLLIGISTMVTRRLHRIGTDLQQISSHNRWSDTVRGAEGRDELSLLARNVNHVLGVIHRQVQQLELLAQTDALTGVANRRAFDHRLRLDLAAITRNDQPLSLLLLDVDYFKLYNDCHGHPAGDAVLAAIGAVLKESAGRPTDFSARIGGEEFAILMPNTDVLGAQVIAERIRAHLAMRALAHDESPIAEHVTVSIGVTVARAGETPANVASRADQALYQAKRDGRNCVRWSSPQMTG